MLDDNASDEELFISEELDEKFASDEELISDEELNSEEELAPNEELDSEHPGKEASSFPQAVASPDRTLPQLFNGVMQDKAAILHNALQYSLFAFSSSCIVTEPHVLQLTLKTYAFST